jgi:hypothetical protein
LSLNNIIKLNTTQKIPVRIKFDNESPNEFTNGFQLKFNEIIFILLILLLWILSLRKLFYNFEKLRTTHYREIPYKFRGNNPNKIEEVRIVKNQTESVICDRRKSIRSKSLCLVNNKLEAHTFHTNSVKPRLINIGGNNENTTIINFCNENNNVINETTSRQSSRKSFQFDSSNLKTQISVAKFRSESESSSQSENSLQSEKKLSSSMDNISECGESFNKNYIKVRHSDAATHIFSKDFDPISSNENGNNVSKGQMLDAFREPSNLIDTTRLSPIVKKSLLDLHQKSIENVAAASAAAALVSATSSVSASATHKPYSFRKQSDVFPNKKYQMKSIKSSKNNQTMPSK